MKEGWLIAPDDGTELPLVGARLRATARGGLAEVVLEQRFRNPRPTPLTVLYTFPLPLDAAVAGFAFTIGDRRIVGELERRQDARARFEEALLEGKTAALLDEDRPTLFRQELGNIPPGAEVTALLTIDQRLAWVDEGQDEGVWEWRFPTAAGPRYTRDGDGDGAGDVDGLSSDALPARLALELSIDEGAVPESPSHRLLVADGRVAIEPTALDRDLVVRWRARREPGLEGARRGDESCGLLTVVPPAAGQRAPLPRDLVVLLDTSGSMTGEPLRQARAVVAALLDGLGERDTLEMIAFAREPQRWRAGPLAVTADVRGDARAWLAALEAGGGTEMRRGIEEALRPLRPDSQRQVVLVTDGLIGGEMAVVRSVAEGLPAGARLHTVGVGSAVNRSLTGPASRAGRGVEVVVGLGEDAERAARRLVARTAAPLVVDVTLSGTALRHHAPARLPDLFAGAPLLITLALRPEGGTLAVEGRSASGRWHQTLSVPPIAPGAGRAAVVNLYGRERIEDLETRLAAGDGQEPLEREIERLGLELGISTRLTSWVAVGETTTARGGPIHRVRMPQQLPHGMSVDALGLRRGGDGRAITTTMTAMVAMPSPRMLEPPATFVVRGFVPPRAQLGGPPSPAPTVLSGPSWPSERMLNAVSSTEGDVLVVRFLVEGGALVWPGQIELVGAHGETRQALVLESPLPGILDDGVPVELRLAVDPALPVPRALLISQGRERVRVLL
jgi:Ca-activated chloride channel family protein